VYYISRGKVKPANKAFAAVRNDYIINLDNGCFFPHAFLTMQIVAMGRAASLTKWLVQTHCTNGFCLLSSVPQRRQEFGHKACCT
jgi:hypothetical protein